MDDTLFQRIMHNPYHIIHHYVGARRELVCNIRQRHHDRQLSIVSGQLHNRNFINRMLFKDCYWLSHIYVYYPNAYSGYDLVTFFIRPFIYLYFSGCVLSFCLINEYDLNGQIRTLPARNTLVQLLALYTNPESHNAQHHRQTDGRTGRRTDNRIMPIAVRSAIFISIISTKSKIKSTWSHMD